MCAILSCMKVSDWMRMRIGKRKGQVEYLGMGAQGPGGRGVEVRGRLWAATREERRWRGKRRGEERHDWGESQDAPHSTAWRCAARSGLPCISPSGGTRNQSARTCRAS
eukprot:3858699-Pleurochrysis_carterae.AAC.6